MLRPAWHQVKLLRHSQHGIHNKTHLDTGYRQPHEMVDTQRYIRRICTTKSFNWHLWTKVHQIFHTCKTYKGLFTVKVWQGLQQKRESPKKPEIFTLVHVKVLTMFTSRGQRSRSNVHLHGRFHPVPQPFYACRNLLLLRSYQLQTVGTDHNFSVLAPKILFERLAPIWDRRS